MIIANFMAYVTQVFIIIPECFLPQNIFAGQFYALLHIRIFANKNALSVHVRPTDRLFAYPFSSTTEPFWTKVREMVP